MCVIRTCEATRLIPSQLDRALCAQKARDTAGFFLGVRLASTDKQASHCSDDDSFDLLRYLNYLKAD